jgi:hypothetical protein
VDYTLFLEMMCCGDCIFVLLQRAVTLAYQGYEHGLGGELGFQNMEELDDNVLLFFLVVCVKRSNIYPKRPNDEVYLLVKRI